MADAAACQAALQRLAGRLDALDPEQRARHVPDRSVSCRIPDLGLAFVGRIGPDGCSAVEPADQRTAEHAEVRATVDSAVLIDIADRRTSLVHAWLHGSVSVSAGIRDILRLRSFVAR